MTQRLVAPFFYFGVLLSSIGSGAFGNSLMAFMILYHFPLSQAAMIIGLQRLVPTAFLAICGHWTDRLEPRKTIVTAEILGAVSSLALIYAWNGSDSDIALIGLLTVGRAVIVSFQQGSRAKVSKALSGSTYAGNSKHAIWLNKATQGSTLFSGALAWFFVKYGSLEIAILFDFITFVANGIIVFFMPAILAPNEEMASHHREIRENWFSKFRDFLSLNRSAALYDLFLFAGTGGLMAYSARLSGTDPSWVGLFVAAYGLAVWAAGFAERQLTREISIIPFWFGMGLSYLALGQTQGPSWGAISISFARDFSFWIIFHRTSAAVQMKTPFAKMGAVSNARMVLIVILSAGAEILVGAWSNWISLSSESILRAMLLFGFAFYLLIQVKRRPSLQGAAIE